MVLPVQEACKDWHSPCQNLNFTPKSLGSPVLGPGMENGSVSFPEARRWNYTLCRQLASAGNVDLFPIPQQEPQWALKASRKIDISESMRPHISRLPWPRAHRLCSRVFFKHTAF